jgi:cyclopropane-fatty-acyl-phospholipid synthase
MWEFYLAGAEMGFRNQGLMVFQIQVAKRVDALPIVRDYMIPRPEAETIRRQRVMS